MVLAVVVVGSALLLSATLQSQDTTLTSYLSGMVVSVTGGPGQNQLIRVNLHNLSLALYEDGNLFLVNQVSATGNPYNRTATPVGEYSILSKEPRHISGLSGVIMPWAMRFYGGYYFHDIPLTPKGAIITTKYSAGCIRIASSIVRTFYDWTKIGARVQIYRADLVKDAVSPTVYSLTENGLRKPIHNPQAFESHGFRWENIVVVPSAELAALPLGETIY